MSMKSTNKKPVKTAAVIRNAVTAPPPVRATARLVAILFAMCFAMSLLLLGVVAAFGAWRVKTIMPGQRGGVSVPADDSNGGDE
jgi:hypothetical protein